jgi:hypothetical protein
VVAGIVALAIGLSIAGVGYEQLDLNGYISHDRMLDVYMTNNWLVGENRICSLSHRYDANGKLTGQLGRLCTSRRCRCLLVKVEV